MCRHLAYIGPMVTLEKLIIEPKHSLRQQAREPRHQTQGTVNADGFGVGWYDRDKRGEPARYRTTRPIWADPSFASIAGLVSANAVLAAVRNASPGMPIEETSTAPFTDGPWRFSHNGFVPGFRTGVGRALRREVSELRANATVGATDSQLLFVLDDRHLTGAVVIASEPYDDDPSWETVPDGSVVELGDDKLEVRPF